MTERRAVVGGEQRVDLDPVGAKLHGEQLGVQPKRVGKPTAASAGRNYEVTWSVTDHGAEAGRRGHEREIRHEARRPSSHIASDAASPGCTPLA